MSQSYETTVWGSTDNAFTTGKIALGVRDADVLGDQEYGVAQGKRGTRQDYEGRAAILSETVSGGFSIFPTVAELDWLLAVCIGSGSGPWVIPEAMPAWSLWSNKGNIQWYKYADVRTTKMVISGTEGDFCTVRVDVIGGAETAVSAPVTTGVTVDNAATFPFSLITLTIGGTVYKIKSFTLTIDHKIAQNQQENQATRSVFESEGLEIMLEVTAAWRSDTKALYRRAIAGDAATLTLSNGTVVYSFSFANVKTPGRGPTTPESGEITQVPAMKAFRTTGAAILTVTKA